MTTILEKDKEKEMQQNVITYRGTVYPWQCDHMGHMNVMWYVGKFDEASWQMLHTLGLTSSRMKAEGIVMAAVEQHLQYKRELRAGDVITIRSSILEVKDKSIRMAHEMRNDETDEIVATTVTVGLHVDAKLRKACSLPSDVRARALSKSGPERGADHSDSSDVVQLLVDGACGASSSQ